MSGRIETARQREKPRNRDRSVRDLAVRTMHRRLKDVWKALERACLDRGEPEGIHGLRVASRRAIAAIDAFADLLPRGDRRWFRRRLRELRRAAGEARDLDVLADVLTDAGPHAPSSIARRRLVAMLSRRRPRARRPVVAARERLLAAGWEERVADLVDRLAKRRSDQSATVFSRKRLKRVVRRFFERADRDILRGSDLHRLRIDGKRLRYAVEIFAAALTPAIRRRCEKTLESLQDGLGRYTDHDAIANRLHRWSGQPVVEADRRLLKSLERAEHDAADRERRKFVTWWTRARRRTLRRRFRKALRKDSA